VAREFPERREPMIKPIPGFPDYLASSNGRIYSTKKWRGSTVPRKLNPYNNGGKYLKVNFRKRNKGAQPYVHNLVYITFIGPVSKGWHVHHIDGDHTNNSVENLQALHPLEHCRLHQDREERTYGNILTAPKL
jgi:hypothetical protein